MGPGATGRPLRIAMLGDFDGVHARAWAEGIARRGHEVHAVSFYPPGVPLDGVTVHALRACPASTGGERGGGGRGERLPRGLLRLAHAARYRAAGLPGVLRALRPDVLHAHYLVEHGFYGTFAGVRPYVVTAWGSDVLVEPGRDPVSNLIARWTVRRADLLTSNNAYMAGRLVALGAAPAKVEVVTLGADASFLERADASVNVRGRTAGAPTVLSTRAHEPLYNIDEIIAAYATVARARPDVRLAVAHGGSQTAALQRRAREVAGRVEFVGFIEGGRFGDLLADAEVFVSVPSSDGTSVALLQAMAAGCFPIVADLPSQRELVEHGVNGLQVAPHRPDALAEAMLRALGDAELRRSAAARNRALVQERGLNEREMARMEALYRRLLPVS